MKECVPTKKEPVGSIAIAHHNISVNVVKLIDVVLTNAKMVERVLFLLLTIFQRRNVNVQAIMPGLLVSLIFAWVSNVTVELVLPEPVNVIKIISTSITPVKKHVR